MNKSKRFRPRGKALPAPPLNRALRRPPRAKAPGRPRPEEETA